MRSLPLQVLEHREPRATDSDVKKMLSVRFKEPNYSQQV